MGPELSDAIEKFDSYSEFCEFLIRRKMTLGLLCKVPLLPVTTAIGGIDLAVTVCFRVSHETRLLFSAGKFVLRANLREMPNLIRIFMNELWQTGFEAVSVGGNLQSVVSDGNLSPYDSFYSSETRGTPTMMFVTSTASEAQEIGG